MKNWIVPLVLVSAPAMASCPTDFTPLGKLGCIQTKIEGQARCIEAIQTCFKNHGGRLPSYSEMVAALTLPVEANLRYEWVDSSSINTTPASTGSSLETTYWNCGVIGIKNSIPLAEVYYNKTIGYRCFVPFE